MEQSEFNDLFLCCFSKSEEGHGLATHILMFMALAPGESMLFTAIHGTSHIV